VFAHVKHWVESQLKHSFVGERYFPSIQELQFEDDGPEQVLQAALHTVQV
jgi:hypothetical protein